MNIFEALNEGRGRATLPEKRQQYVTMFITADYRYKFVWSHDLLHGVFDIELRSNDWIPFVSLAERKRREESIDLLQSIYKPFLDDYKKRMAAEANVPRGTCFNCGQAMPLPKTKHKEVFENVVWFSVPYVTYPNIDINKKASFPGKPPMKMTLEWEE